MCSAQAEMPRYKCHKVVHALKIKRIFVKDGQTFMEPEEVFAPIGLSEAYLAKHKPAPGGYYIVYEDGYLSFSPAEAFESGYTLLRGNSKGFGEAIEALRCGKSVSRRGWNGKGQKLTLIEPKDGSDVTLPYIAITTVQGDTVPWLASQTDMLAHDWTVV